MVFDSCVTSDLGFTNDRGRCLVNTTRAVDLSIVIGQLLTLTSPLYSDAKIVALFKLAGDKGIVRTLPVNALVLQHEFVRARVVMTIENQAAYNDAYEKKEVSTVDEPSLWGIVATPDTQGPVSKDITMQGTGNTMDRWGIAMDPTAPTTATIGRAAGNLVDEWGLAMDPTATTAVDQFTTGTTDDDGW